MLMDPSISNSLPPFIITKQGEGSDDDDSFMMPNVVETVASENINERKQHSYNSGVGDQEKVKPSSAPKSRRAKNPANREHRMLKIRRTKRVHSNTTR